MEAAKTRCTPTVTQCSNPTLLEPRQPFLKRREPSPRIRLRGRARSGEPKSTGGLGAPPPYFMIQEPEIGFRKAGILRELWYEIGNTAPWLDAANRGQVETLCRIRYAIRLGEGKLNVNAASQSKLENDLGITQSARSRCNVPSKPPERATGEWQTLAEEGRRERPN